MTAAAQWVSNSPDKIADDWQVIAARAPRMASTMGRYLTQTSTFLAPRSIEAASISLRQLAFWLLEHTDVTALAAITRDDIEDFTVWLADQPGQKGPVLSANTRSQRLHMLRTFFARIIEWDWDDAPRRNPVLKGDIPARPDALPRFLDDDAAAKLMIAARAATDARDRLVIELLSRTGLRASEASGLAADAVVHIGAGHWLRVPVGKLRNDRFVPLHPQLVELLDDWCATNLDHIRTHRRLIADHRGTLSRDAMARIVRRIATRAGIGHVTPHQLRHTLATPSTGACITAPCT
jgi:site-specific recombinase XerD